jgi:hypothetical protein
MLKQFLKKIKSNVFNVCDETRRAAKVSQVPWQYFSPSQNAVSNYRVAAHNLLYKRKAVRLWNSKKSGKNLQDFILWT